MHTLIKLVVCLGNPGTKYQSTRHNAGFWMGEVLAEKYMLQLRTEKRFSSVQAIHPRFQLLFPQTFMNLSGKAVSACVNYYRYSSEEVLVIHDEIDLQAGQIRLKFAGGHGGHNGLRDIFQHLNTRSFHRLRIGIGHPQQRALVHDHVLTTPMAEEKEKIFKVIHYASQSFDQILAGEHQTVMNHLHSDTVN